MTPNELSSAIANARSARVTPVGGLDPRNRRRGKPLTTIEDANALELLREALAIDETSVEDELSLMTTGTVEIHFFDGHELLVAVTFIAPSWLRWRDSGFDWRLRDSARVAMWLESRGVSPPSA